MDPEREETYERIPWETLEKKQGDRQWVVYAVAGAIALGALAFSFMRNQPTAAPAPEAAPVPAMTTVPATTAQSNIGSTPTTVASPVVVAEADLYSVDPERLVDQAAGHAEWAAVEYLAVDGSKESRAVLKSLLPAGIPVPDAPEGTQVFVDWARARSVVQTGPVSFDVEVLVRSLVSTVDSGFVRQPPQLVRVPVEIGDDGLARLTGVPSIEAATAGAPSELTLAQPPEEVMAAVKGRGEVVGGIQRQDGSWDVVVMTTGPDGVKRAVTLRP